MRDRLAPWLVFAFLGVLMIFPLIVVLLISVVPRWYTRIPNNFGFDWWFLTLSKGKYIRIILNSIGITIASTALIICYAIIASYIFAFHDFRWKQLLSLAMLSPAYVSGVVIALGLLTAFPPIRNTFWILILGHFIIVFPPVFRSILSSMMKVPKSLVEVSSSLGSTSINTFLRIILPLSMKGIMAGITLSIGLNMSELSVSLLVYGPDWVLIPIQIYLEWWRGCLGVAGVLSGILVVLAIFTVFTLNYLGEQKIW